MLLSMKDSFFTCQPVNKSAIDTFCTQLLPSLPAATCVDAAGYPQRSERDYDQQRDECSTAHKRKKTCPNEPSKCTTQVFTYEEYCGVYDQQCSSDKDCLGFCFSDCYPCNSRSDCEILEGFGVIAPEGAPCFSPHNHSSGDVAALMRDLLAKFRRNPAAPVETVAADRFPLFWNVDENEEPRVDVTEYGFQPRSATQVGNGCASDPPPHSNPGCASWTQGLFPTIGDDGSWVHGGVPQNADLDAHLAELRATLPSWIPDPHFTGNAVLDFEAWTTVWELNTSPDNWHGERYRNASRYLVAKAHPRWNATAVEAEAKRAFEGAATSWFVKTLQTCRALRPRARWGFYGLPQAAFGDCAGSGASMRCGFDGPNGAALRQRAEVAQLPIWQASDAIFPSIYIPHSMAGKPDNVSAYIRSTVGEAVRCARLAGTANGVAPKPVFPYGWDHFHAPPSPPVRVPTSFLLAQLQHSADAGAAGVVMWGSGEQANDASYWAWYMEEAGPAIFEWCRQREGGC